MFAITWRQVMCLGGCIVWLHPGTVHADAPPALTLDTVIETVLQRFPLLIAAEKEKVIAEGELLSAQGGFDPQWSTYGTWSPVGKYKSQQIDTSITQPTPLWGTSFSAGYRIGNGFPYYYGGYETFSQGEVRAGVAIPLWRDGFIDKRRAALWSAKLEPKAATAAVTNQRIEIARAASIRYWNWVEAGNALGIAREVLRLAEDRDEGLAARVERGDISAIERQENQRAILARKSMIVQIERSYAGAVYELSVYLGENGRGDAALHTNAVPPLVEPLPLTVGNVDDEVAHAIARRPDLARLAVQKEQLGIEYDLAKNQGYPSIDLNASVEKNFGTGPAYVVPTEVDLGVSIDIPILARGAKGKQQVTRNKIDKLALQASYLRSRITADVKDSVMAESTSRQRLVLARNELALAKTLAQAERDSLELGSSTVLIVNLREQAVFDAALREVTALADCHRAIAVFRAVTATQPGV